jgi:hypothetical protein
MTATLAPNAAVPLGAKKAEDEAGPKTLYIKKPLLNADALRDWAKAQGFKTTLPPGDMHVTLAFSKTPVEWNDILDKSGDHLTQDAGTEGRAVEPLGDKGAIVLRFDSPALTQRWHQIRGAGASWDHDGYRPHVTITYDAGDVDLSKVTPYDGPLEFGGEVRAEVDSDWADKVKKNLQATDFMPKVLARLKLIADRRQLAADSKITLDVDDEDGRLEALLLYIKENSEGGHSFDVVVDPDDPELTQKFYLDGDGAFRIRDIAMAMDRSANRSTAVMASDSPMHIAMDRDSVREKTRDGRLIVHRTHITKANVCPYRGEEIPGWEKLGLDPQRVYNLLRDPDELAKAAPTLNGVQLLIKHKPVNSKAPQQEITVGSLGSNAEFDGEYLDNSLYVNVQEAIDAIEQNRQRELSAGYHYVPDMTPGNFRGSAYDGVMRDIVFNHVALVEDGRAGPDVVVGDEALKEIDMAKVTRFGAMTLSLAASSIAPLLAMDQKIVLPKDLFTGLTTKNFKAGRDKLLSGVRLAVDGKLRSGIALDASMQDFAKAIDAFNDDMTAGVDEPAPEAANPEIDKMASVEAPKGITQPGATYDAEPLKGFLKDCGMDDDKIAKCMDMMPKPGMVGDADETPEEKAAREKKEADAAAAKDAEMKDMVSKPAMDAALKAQGAEFQKQLKAVRDSERGVRVAIAEVHPWTGDLPATMAFDSATDVYRHALVMKNVDGAKTLHADALLPILKTLPKNGARNAEHVDTGSSIAMDSSAVSEAIKIAPGLEHISNIL